MGRTRAPGGQIRTAARDWQLAGASVPRHSRGSISHYVLRLARKAAVRLSVHRLRKGFGCRVAKSIGKAGAALLHELMRHANMQTTMDDDGSVDDAKQEAMSRLT
jgi:integrase